MDGDPPLRQWAAEVERPEQEIDLARAALVLARMEYADLDIGAYLGRLGELAARAEAGCRKCTDLNLLHCVREYLFAEVGFAGNRDAYSDPRNSFLNDVLDRKLGVPITLSILYMDIASRLGLELEGVSFPGHFLVKFSTDEGDVVLDPFNGGAILTPDACADLVARALGRRVRLTDADFAPVTKRQLLARMLRAAEQPGFIAGIQGGNKPNAIPREAWATVVIPEGEVTVNCTVAGSTSTPAESSKSAESRTIWSCAYNVIPLMVPRSMLWKPCARSPP